jgi:hypothetical protein
MGERDADWAWGHGWGEVMPRAAYSPFSGSPGSQGFTNQGRVWTSINKQQRKMAKPVQYISNEVLVQCLYKLLTLCGLYVELRYLRMFYGLVLTLPKLSEMRMIMLSLIESAE